MREGRKEGNGGKGIRAKEESMEVKRYSKDGVSR